jgi:hypothetical protein
MERFTYQYETTTPKFTTFEDGKPRGGFVGTHAIKQLFNALMAGKQITFVAMDEQKEKSKKVQELRAAWISLGIDNMRKDIMKPYGVESTKDLTIEQLDELLKRFSSKYFRTPPDAEGRRLRSIALTLLTRYGVYSTNDDWHQVNRFLMDRRIAGKLMYEMDTNDLNALIRKLRAMLDKKEREDAETRRLTTCN